MNMTQIDSNQDIIDVRDIIEHVEEHESREPNEDTLEDVEEYQRLAELLGELRGYGGMVQWRGDWYPNALVRDSYFSDYIEEMAADIYGDDLRSGEWPFSCIDWERAAREAQMDYTSVEYDGITYWYR